MCLVFLRIVKYFLNFSELFLWNTNEAFLVILFFSIATNFTLRLIVVAPNCRCDQLTSPNCRSTNCLSTNCRRPVVTWESTRKHVHFTKKHVKISKKLFLQIILRWLLPTTVTVLFGWSRKYVVPKINDLLTDLIWSVYLWKSQSIYRIVDHTSFGSFHRMMWINPMTHNTYEQMTHRERMEKSRYMCHVWEEEEQKRNEKKRKGKYQVSHMW